MSGFQDNPFPSQFDESFFNSSSNPFLVADIDEEGTSLPSVSNEEEAPLKVKRLILRHFGSLPLDCKEYNQNATITAVIILKETSDAIVKKGTDIHNLAFERSFSAADIERVSCLALSQELMAYLEKNSEDETLLQKAVEWYVEWVFRGDYDAQTAYLDRFLFLARSYYYKNNPIQLLDEILIGFFNNDIGAPIRKGISKASQYLADSLRELKIGEGQEHLWKPVDTENGVRYEPLFIPKHVIELSEFSIKVLDLFAQIESRIIEDLTSELDQMDQGLGGDQYLGELIPRTVISEISAVLKEVPTPFQALLAIVDEIRYANELANAFLVGLLNGIIELVASTLELISILNDYAKFKALLKSIVDILKILSIPYVRETLLLSLLNTFISKYRNAESSHDIAKYLGEDLAELILSILQVATGIGAAKVAGQLAARVGIKIGPKAAGEFPSFIKRWMDDLKSPEDTRKLLEREGRDSDLKLEPRIFDDLSPDQKRYYQEQHEILAEIDKTGEVPLGTKTNKSGETVPRVKKDNTAKGNWGQMSCTQDLMNRAPFRARPLHQMVTSISSKIVNRRIDCIFENLDYKPPGPPPKYLLFEAKSFGSTQSITKAGVKQSAFEWNMKRLEDTLRDNPEFKDMDEVEMEALLLEIEVSHESFLYRKKEVLNDDGTPVAPEVWRLNNDGDKVENITHEMLLFNN